MTLFSCLAKRPHRCFNRPPVSSSPKEGLNLRFPGILPMILESGPTFLPTTLHQHLSPLTLRTSGHRFTYVPSLISHNKEIPVSKETSINARKSLKSQRLRIPSGELTLQSVCVILSPPRCLSAWTKAGPNARDHLAGEFGRAQLLTRISLWSLYKQTGPQSTAFAEDFYDGSSYKENLVAICVTPYLIPPSP